MSTFDPVFGYGSYSLEDLMAMIRSVDIARDTCHESKLMMEIQQAEDECVSLGFTTTSPVCKNNVHRLAFQFVSWLYYRGLIPGAAPIYYRFTQ